MKAPELVRYRHLFYATGSGGPPIVSHQGNNLMRYMDRIYLPSPPSKLDPEAVSELAELRVLLGDEIIDHQYTQSLLAHLYKLATGGQGGLRLLDVGCGDGNIVSFALSLPRSERPNEIVGVDLCPRVVKACEERLESSNLGTALLIDRNRPILLRANAFDAAIANFVFHFPISRREASEIHRILSPGGRFAYNDYRYHSDPDHFSEVLRTFQSVGFAAETYDQEFRQRHGDGFRTRMHKVVLCAKKCAD